MPMRFCLGRLTLVTAMVSVGLYGHQSFVDSRLLLGKIAVATILVLMLVSFSAAYWREGLDYLPDAGNFPVKATLIWLVCVSVTRSTFSVTLGRGMLRRRVLVLGNGAGFSVRRPDELQPALKAALAHADGPSLVEIHSSSKDV